MKLNPFLRMHQSDDDRDYAELIAHAFSAAEDIPQLGAAIRAIGGRQAGLTARLLGYLSGSYFGAESFTELQEYAQAYVEWLTALKHA